MDNSIKGRYKIILGRDLLTTLGLYLKFYYHVIVDDKEPYEACLAPMVGVSNCNDAPLKDNIFLNQKNPSLICTSMIVSS